VTTSQLTTRRRGLRWRVDSVVELAAGVLVVVGGLVGLAAGAQGAVATGRSLVVVVVHEVLWLAIAALAGLTSWAFVRRFGVRSVLRLAPLALAATLVGLAAVMVPGVGTTVGGASRWIALGPFELQPSEFAKLALVLFLARLVVQRGPGHSTAPVLVVTGLMAAMVFVEPDMGTALVVAALGFGALVVAQVPWRRLAAMAGAGATVVAIGALSSAYRRARLLSFLHPWRYRLSLSYQEAQALSAFASAHLTGSGLGNGIANWGYVPNASTDFVYTLVVQDFGVLGGLLVLVALAVLVMGLLALAERVEDPAGHAVVTLVAVWVAVQSVLNLGAVVGLLPVTGVPLPLVSQGGSALVVVAMALGLGLGLAQPRRRRHLR